MEKGDAIIYSFGFGYQDAIVVEKYGNYLKVKHKDYWFFGWHGFCDIIHESRVVGNLKVK